MIFCTVKNLYVNFDSVQKILTKGILGFIIPFFTYNHFHNNLRLFGYYQICLSPQVKRSEIISNEHCIYELLDELPNDLRLRILGN